LKNEILKHLKKLDKAQLAQVARMIDEPVNDSSRVKTTISAYPLVSLDYYKSDVYILDAAVVETSEVTTGNGKGCELYHRVDKNKNHWFLCDALNKGEFLFKNTNLLKQLIIKMENRGFYSIQAIEKYRLVNSVRFFVKHEQNPLTSTFATNMTLISVDQQCELASENLNKALGFLQQSSEYKKLLEEIT